MSLEYVNPPELGTPKGFSHAVVGSGRMVFLAGQTALDADGKVVGFDGGRAVREGARESARGVGRGWRYAARTWRA